MPIYKQHGSDNWLIEFKIDGKRFRRTSGTTVKRIAETLERKWRQDVIEGKNQIKAPTRLTFREAKDRYWKTVVCLKGSREHTKTAEKYALAIIEARFGQSTYLDQISAEEIALWKDALLATGKAPATVNRYLATLRAILNRAHSDWRALRYVPAFKLLPLNNKRTVYLSLDDEGRLLDACSDHLRPLVLCLLDTGARLSEALDLTWGDVVINGNRSSHIIIRKTKNGDPRSIPLTARCRSMFENMSPEEPSPSSPVFTYRNGKAAAVPFRHPYGAWETALKRAQVRPDMRFHDVERLHADLGQPFLNCSRDKFWAIVGPDICWRSACDEQLRQGCQNVLVTEPTRNDERQTFTAGFVDDRQDPELPTVMSATLDKVISPDMPRILWPQPDARPVVQP